MPPVNGGIYVLVQSERPSVPTVGHEGFSLDASSVFIVDIGFHPK